MSFPSSQTGQPQSGPGIPFVEFVAMIAALMALNALAMDIMLPALPYIGDSLQIANPNDRSQILIAYLVGFGAAQIFFGPVSDTLGRRPLVVAGLSIYSLASIACLFSQTLEQLLVARAIQGLGCAAVRVIATSVVRDCYSGRRMGSVMSLIMMVFMIIPIFAPSIGQLVLLVANWHWIFTFLLLAGLIMLFWCTIRLPETLNEENRRPLRLKPVLESYACTLTNRASLGYMLAMTFVMGGLFSFITMSQQIFVDVFGLGVWFPLFFAGIAICMSLSSFANARLVEALGMRFLSHTATLVYTISGFILYLCASHGLQNLASFTVLACCILGVFGFMGANFNSMAMEPLGKIAGTASSVIGFVTTLGGAILGYMAAQSFDGTTAPLGMACGLYGTGALLCSLYAEKGHLFRAVNNP